MGTVLEENPVYGDVVAMTDIADRESDGCCCGGLFLPDETYVPTTLAQVRKVFRAMRADARNECVPGGRCCTVSDDELVGFQIVVDEDDSPMVAQDLKGMRCPVPGCLDGHLDSIGRCTVCETRMIGCGRQVLFVLQKEQARRRGCDAGEVACF